MKIALVSPYDYPYPGGVTSHVGHLYREFSAMGHDVRIMAPSSNRNLERDETDVYRIGNVRKVHANGSIARITLSFRLSRRVHEVLTAERFDVVHAHEPLMPSLPPTVLMYSDAVNVGTFHAYRGSYYGYFYGRPVLRRVFNKLDARIAVSRAAKRFVRQYFMAPYRVIPNGVEVQRFDPRRVEPIRELMDGRPNILFVGRPEKRKGVGYLLRAYPHIKNAFPDARFVVVGAGDWNDSRYRRYIERHDMHDIQIVGRVSEEELPRYLRSANVMCAPAVSGESFGIVLLEAMAAGVPVVASNIEGYSEVVTNGAEGFLVPPRDEHALADAVCSVLQDRGLGAEMGRRGLETSSQYSWQRIAEQLLDLYVKTGERAVASYSPAPITVPNPSI
ncbi:MAG: glycosyltransferase family 4 protein [Chloroflexota bacterium]|nr:MAG: glycosyltransferase family 1 protein [Chloroflexota bacterium]